MDGLELDIIRRYRDFQAMHYGRDARQRELGLLLVKLHQRDHRQGSRSGLSFAQHLHDLDNIARGTAYRAMRAADRHYYETYIVRPRTKSSRRKSLPHLTFSEWLRVGEEFVQDGIITKGADEDMVKARRIVAWLQTLGAAVPIHEIADVTQIVSETVH